MFKLEIKTENSAFDGNCNEEIARILRNLADSLVNDEPGNYYEYTLKDINGNTVGIVTRCNY
jgi:hypothetical protein